MSTQNLPACIGARLGRFTFALLIGAMLTLSGLLPSVAFAHPHGQTASDPISSLDKAGVSVVRLAVTYSNTNGTTNQQKGVVCTGLGVLVGSTPVSGSSSSHGPYQSWVLTDANLLSSGIPGCQLPNADTATIDIYRNNSYTQASTNLGPLGEVSCPIGGNALDITCHEKNGTVSEPIVIAPNSYALLAFQTTNDQPYLTFASSPITAPIAIGLVNSSQQSFPAFRVDSASPKPLDYLTPKIVSSNGAGNAAQSSPTTAITPTATAGNSTGLEPGTPLVDARGDLAGISLSGGKSFSDFSTVLPGLSALFQSANTPKPGSVTDLWKQGIASYNQGTQASCRQAQSTFQKISPLNPDFKAAAAFAVKAQAQTCVSQTTPGTLPPFPQNSLQISPLLVGLVAGLITLLLLLVLVTLRVGKVHRRRRELERFAAEHAEGQRRAEVEIERQRTQRPEVFCPNCHNPVHLSDTMCRHCRYPLSPSASGAGVRLAGSGPLPVSAPLPPAQTRPSMPVSPAASMSDMPTLQLPPNVTASANDSSAEKTIKRKKSRPISEEATVYDLQSARERNLNLIVGTRSDPGLKRKHKPNEDSLFAIQGARTHNSQPQQFGLFVIADGMGGHANGQDASRQAIQSVIDYLLPRISTSVPMDDEAFKKLLGDGVQNANLAVHQRNLEVHADMGTTMTAALVVGATAYVANVGDSRTYLYRKGQGLAKVTLDHSVVASLVEAGIIQPDDIYTHPKRSQIYRSLGEKPVIEVDTFMVPLQPGDKLLLCSDGLWDMVRDPQIEQVISKAVNDPNKTTQDLIKAALQGGGEDNVTVIVVQVSEQNSPTGTTGMHLHVKPDTVTLPSLP